MLHLFKKRFQLLLILGCGASLADSITLARALWSIYLRKRTVPFACRLRCGARATPVLRFRGTYDELLMIQEIFVEREYRNLRTHDTVLDTGANIGLATAWLSCRNPGARIHAYEPSPRTFAALSKNVGALSGVRLFEEAIAPSAGEVTLHESDRDIESSLVFDFPHMHDLKVRASTLDQAVERLGGHVGLLKMDIEGAEFDVLSRATCLARIEEIVGEGHPGFARRELAEIRTALEPTHQVEIDDIGAKSVRFYAIRRDLLEGGTAGSRGTTSPKK